MTENEKIKPARGRSRAYPVIALGEALERIKSIDSNLGASGKYNRESIAAGMGYSSLNGTSSRRIAALVQYGFLGRDNDMYYLSPLARKYLLPLEDSDPNDAIREAALTPVLFSEIYDALKGQFIPKQFVNRLIQEFRIEQKVAPEVEKIFKSTMETAGVLQANGTLKDNLDQEQGPSVASPAQHSKTPDNNSSDQSGEKNITPSGHLSVKLPSGLIVSYSQELASEFAFGTFGKQLKDLDEAVAKYVTTSKNSVDEEEV